jgi:hypothetical protein
MGQPNIPLECLPAGPRPVLEKMVILIRRAQWLQWQESRAARYSINSGQAADAANEAAPPLGKVTSIARIGLYSPYECKLHFHLGQQSFHLGLGFFGVAFAVADEREGFEVGEGLQLWQALVGQVEG